MTQTKPPTSETLQKIAILGCGVTGLSLAQSLSKQSCNQITLFDSYNKIGGNHISTNIEGFTFDIGTFLFPRGGEFFDCFPDIEKYYVEATPTFGRINPFGQLDVYPFSVHKYYSQSSLAPFILDVVDLLISKLKYNSKNDVPGYAKYYLGSRIYNKSGLKNYIERFYGIPDSSIDLKFAIKRMYMIGSGASLRRNFSKIFTSRKLKVSYNPIFLVRPQSGFENAYGPLQMQMESNGIHFKLNTKIIRITRTENIFTVHHSSTEESFNRIISTIPINETLEIIQQKTFYKLPSQKLISLFIKLDGNLNFSDYVFYNFMSHGLWKRLTVYSRFYGKVEGCEYFTVEVPAGPDEEVDIHSHFDKAINHLKKHNLFSGIPTLLGWHILENAYPIYTKDNRNNIELSKNNLTAFGIESAGRQGNFDYIPAADLAVKKVVEYLKKSQV